VLSIVVGALVGLAAAALILGIDFVANAVGLGDVDHVSWWVPLITVSIGLSAAHVIGSRLAPEALGDGVPETTAALTVRAGYLPTRAFFVKLVATALTVGAGGSAGREGPMVQLGGTVGSKVARWAGVGEDRVRSLVAAGAGAAIGASFNAPIAGMLFALEVILGAFAIRHLHAVVVASVTAAVTSRSIVGSDRILSAFAFQLSDARELLLYAVLGLLVVVAGIAFLRLVDWAEALHLGTRVPGWLRAAIFGLVVALVAMVDPAILGDGQEFVAGLVRPVDQEPLLWWMLGGLALLKIVATAFTLGGRGSGGAFMPSLFIGAAVGAGFGELLEPLWGISTLHPGAFAVVGMAASFAVIARAPLTAILIVFEITGDYGLVLPLMLATSLATFVADRWHPESVYSMALHRMGIRELRPAEVDLLDTIDVGRVMTRSAPQTSPDATTAEAQGELDRSRSHGVAVVDDRGILVGILAVTDIVRGGGPSDQMTVGDVMTPGPVTVTALTPVSAALERMAALGVGRLPVVDADDPTRLVGMFRREDAVRAYHLALDRRVDDEQSRQQLGARTHPGADFFEFGIPAGSVADGRPIKHVSWPSGCTVVSVRRDRDIAVPNGETVLIAGDILTIYGTRGGRQRLAERLARPAKAQDASGDGPAPIQ